MESKRQGSGGRCQGQAVWQAGQGNSGGTGLNSYTAEDILVANSTNGFRKLGIGSAGYVLQSNGSALVYDTLDGGIF